MKVSVNVEDAFRGHYDKPTYEDSGPVRDGDSGAAGPAIRRNEMKVPGIKLSLMLVTLLVLSAHVPAQDNVEKATNYNNEGVKQTAEGNYMAAIESFNKALRLNPNYSTGHYNLGSALNHLKRYESGISALRRAIALFPTYADAYNELGVAYVGLDQNEKAVVALSEAIRLKPDFTIALYNLGCVHIRLNQHKEAIDALEKAKQLDGTNAKIRMNLSYAYTQQTRWSKAIEEMKEAVKIDPTAIEPQYFLGILYLATGDKVSALAQHQKLTSLNSSLGQRLLRSIHRGKVVSVLEIKPR